MRTTPRAYHDRVLAGLKQIQQQLAAEQSAAKAKEPKAE